MERSDDEELRNLLREWQVPSISPSVEERVLTARRPWWRFLLDGYVRVPIPVVCCLVVLLAAAEGWRWTTPAQTVAPRIIVRIERVEVPVMRKQVVTKVVYKNRPVLADTPDHSLTFRQLRPVGELRPRIIRGGHDQY
jgi:hypothetical protein